MSKIKDSLTLTVKPVLFYHVLILNYQDYNYVRMVFV